MRQTPNRIQGGIQAGSRAFASGSLKDGNVIIFVPLHKTDGPDGAMGEGIAIDSAGNLFTAEATVQIRQGLENRCLRIANYSELPAEHSRSLTSNERSQAPSPHDPIRRQCSHLEVNGSESLHQRNLFPLASADFYLIFQC